MLRSTLDPPARRLRPGSLGRSLRIRLASVLAPRHRLLERSLEDPDAGPAPSEDRLVSKAARRVPGPDRSAGRDATPSGPRRRDRGPGARRFVAQRDGEATHRIWRDAAIGSGPGLR